MAFKEWSVIVDALGRGDQIIILRKGGIAEGPDGFKVEYERFLLFPTLYHQQRENVIDAARVRFDQIQPTLPPPDRVRIEFVAEVVEARKLETLEDASRLRGQHVWRDEVIASRFDWGNDKGIHALALRICRLARPQELAVAPSYAGCKSWIELETDLNVASAPPVLDDAAFAGRLAAFRAALTSPLTV